ncbi:MAG: hypothetical protein D6800_13650 [Candidatus Zixiibacteriota bacterium]|nr:MAG: hypothetical protein D6800_13650 [candidate division Zixibacteria bacterium]
MPQVNVGTGGVKALFDPQGAVFNQGPGEAITEFIFREQVHGPAGENPHLPFNLFPDGGVEARLVGFWFLRHNFFPATTYKTCTGIM